MTVAVKTPLKEYIEDGVTLAFAAEFRFLNATDLEVSRIQSGVKTVLTYGTQWSAIGGDTDAGGTVTLVASTAGATLRIRRVTARAQGADYETTDTFPAESHEQALDRAMLINQEQDVIDDDTRGRALMVPEGEHVGLLPALAARSSRVSGFDGTGDPVAGPLLATLELLASTALSSLSIGPASSISTVAGMRALLKATLTDGDVVYLLGYYNAFDGGGGLFRWVEGDATTVDNGTVFDAAEGGSGRWKRVDTGLVNIKWFGAKGDGVANDTAALAAALAASKRIFLPPGTYLTDTWVLPTSTDGIEIYGAGAHRTILQARTANTPVFQKEQSAGVVQYSTFRDFSIKAHAAGSTGDAFDCSGFRSVRWVNIRALSNGGSGMRSLFGIAGHPYKAYGLTFESCGIAEQAGWTKVWHTHNNGQGVLYNPNVVTIIDPWIYANTGMDIAIDMANCTLYEITGGLVESSGNYAIRFGSRGKVSAIWLENQAVRPLEFQNTQSVTSSNNLIEDVYLSGFAGAIPLPASCAGNTFINVSGTFTFTPTAGYINNFINAPQGGEPTVARNAGVTGTLTKVEAIQVSNLNGMWRLNYTFLPGSSPGQVQFNITPPAGYSVRHLIATAYDNTSGAPLKCAVGVGINNYWVEVANTNTIRMILQVAYQ